MIYPLPTITDITRGLLIVDRILLKRAFQRLKNRKNSKYFKNIQISDVPWGYLTPIPANISKEFLSLYPNDFKVEFTTLGCNMLKCYKHDYAKPCDGQYIINKNIPVCSEACRGIYEEFNAYLAENFKLKGLETKNNINNNDDNNTNNAGEISFETFSIERPFFDDDSGSINRSGAQNYYCGIQLTDLKTFGILPSARWQKPRSSSSSSSDATNTTLYDPSPSASYLTRSQYMKTLKENPTQVGDMAGLVDSPSLTWDVGSQNLKYNDRYCKRFRK